MYRRIFVSTSFFICSKSLFTIKLKLLLKLCVIGIIGFLLKTYIGKFHSTLLERCKRCSYQRTRGCWIDSFWKV